MDNMHTCMDVLIMYYNNVNTRTNIMENIAGSSVITKSSVIHHNIITIRAFVYQNSPQDVIKCYLCCLSVSTRNVTMPPHSTLILSDKGGVSNSVTK